jgi:3-phenylpropionate/cinnamic acid dioxygenase small subunit
MTEADAIRFVYREARLLDEAQWDAWYELFAEDGIYWVPVAHDQPDGINHTSLAYEDRLLLKLRVERLKQHPFSQHPRSRCQHVLQQPEVERQDGDLWITRTAFHYAEARGDDQQMYAGVVWHHLVVGGDGFSIRLKRVNLLNCDAALPSIQLFL